MSMPVVEFQNISKRYRLGAVGRKTLQEDLSLWWERVRSRRNHQDDEPAAGTPSPEKSIWALKDINLQVEQGEILGIIGPNGAGKSTMLKILSRVTAPTTGRLLIRGRIGSLLEVGVGFHPELTGRENIYLNGAILGMRRSEIDRKFDEIVDFSGIETYIDTPVKRYSSGMRVRLGFAVAAHLEPEILVIDEVLAVGDVAFQKKCLGKMSDIAGEGRTILFVSHNMNAVQSLCSRVGLLLNGRFKTIGEPWQIIQQYLDQYQDLGYVLKKRDSEFIWNGLSEIDLLDIESDIPITLNFQTKNKGYEGVNIDISVTDNNKSRLIHVKSRFLIKPFRLEANQSYRMEFSIDSPRLAPGTYYVTVFIYDVNKETIFWAEDIRAFSIGSKADDESLNIYYDKLWAPILPKYQVTLRSGPEE